MKCFAHREAATASPSDRGTPSWVSSGADFPIARPIARLRLFDPFRSRPLFHQLVAEPFGFIRLLGEHGDRKSVV